MNIGIVGCGITGAYLAWKLSGEHDVIVLEEKKSIGDKPCSGLISERLWKFIPEKRDLVKGEFKTAEINFPDKKVKINFNPKMLLIDRKKLTQYVSDMAVGKGAQILNNHAVKKIFHYKKSRPQLSLLAKRKKMIFQFDCIIGCDGASSLVRNILGVGEPNLRLGIYSFKDEKRDGIKIWPTDNGFSWAIPHGRKTEYGVLERTGSAKKEFNKLKRRFKIKSKDVRSALVPQGLITSNKERIFLCGDAAGLTKPWSGGGVIWSLKSADILIDTIPSVKDYNKKLEAFFSRKLISSDLASKTVRFLGSNIPFFLPKEFTFDSDWVF